ncbi:SMP-30/gluconolactonase/LRE family protein [Fulvimarina sp. 2208YS6-2-32]|uniref:SMP-30/gluconolactonase/LRE family protein n=1 Tax=Fulvimarina uroteuthidis TaxID=3098149 RepID=A0ABU5HYJ7_9HYPH|nr:SMP-30/gluconolactonase/LRE family protein [Fulvimarina sp. 2208YS6-2-32]MDY8107967.1 SMP-30/gluconolactonase/LRE family protein [Fulvimarina sp. 2208YS6-2-32]
MRIREPYEIRDERFRSICLANVDLHQIDDTSHWAEGPVWFGDADCLLWSDIPQNRIMRWTPTGGVSIYRAASNFANGHTRDREGRLVSCEHLTRRVTRTERDGHLTVLADQFEGKCLNSPNDVVVRRDGTIWFTDPTYGILTDYEGDRAMPEQTANGLYRLDPQTGKLERMISDFVQPNGLAFSPDERTLYVAESGASHDRNVPRIIRAFEIGADGNAWNGRTFTEIDAGIPDGIRVDTEGRLWSSAADGVHCFAPDGALLGKILVPEVVANLCFGGIKRNRLFIAATRSIYAIYVNAEGIPMT